MSLAKVRYPVNLVMLHKALMSLLISRDPIKSLWNTGGTAKGDETMPDIHTTFFGGLNNYKTGSHDYQKPKSQVHEEAGRREKGGKYC
jgi:hypothetical protein